MFIEGMTPQPLPKETSVAPSRAREEAKLEQACQQFEEMFLHQMLAQMRKTVPKGGMLGGGEKEEMFQGMLDQERAKNWAQEGGIGLANMLFQQMKQNL